MELSNEDVEVLVYDHCEELAAEYLQDLHTEVQHTAYKEIASYEEDETNVHFSAIKDIFSMWSKVHVSVGENHHSKLLQAKPAICLMIMSYHI